MSERPTIIGLIGPAIASYPPEDQRIFAALGERIASARYRVWAKAVEDDKVRQQLEACADREETIATRVEALRPDAEAVKERILSAHADIQDQFFALLDEYSLREQFSMQAEAERAGAGAWRAYAAAEADEANAETLRSCAPLEEQNAATLEAIVASMPQPS